MVTFSKYNKFNNIVKLKAGSYGQNLKRLIKKSCDRLEIQAETN